MGIIIIIIIIIIGRRWTNKIMISYFTGRNSDG